jgi:hypothetical protein
VVTNTANSQNTAKNSGGTAIASLFFRLQTARAEEFRAGQESIADKSRENSKNSQTRRAARLLCSL